MASHRLNQPGIWDDIPKVKFTGMDAIHTWKATAGSLRKARRAKEHAASFTGGREPPEARPPSPKADRLRP